MGERNSLEGGVGSSGRAEALRRADELVCAQIAAMQVPEDFARVIAEVETQLRALGVSLDSCSVQVVNLDGSDFVCFLSYQHGLYPWQKIIDSVRGVHWPRYTDNAERFPWVVEVWKSGEPRYEPRFPADGHMWPGCSLVDAPTPYGTLAVNARRSDAFSGEDIAAVEHFAKLVGIGLQRFADLAQQSRDALEYTALQEVRIAVQQMEKMEDIEAVMRRIYDGLKKLHIDFHDYSINVLDRATSPPKLHICTTVVSDAMWIAVEARGIVDRVVELAKSKTPVYRSDLSESDPHNEQRDLSSGGNLVRSVIDIPFSHGTMGINSTHRHAFSAQDILFFEKVADMLSQGFWRRDQLQSLRAQRDELERRVAERTNELADNARLLQSLHEISAVVLATPPDTDRLLDELAEKVLLLGLFRSLMIALVDWQLEEVRVVRSFSRWHAERGMLDKIELVPHRLDLVYALDDENITAVTARTGQMQVVEEWDDRLDSRVDTPSYRRGQVAYFIPIKHGARTLAVFATASLVAEKEVVLRRIEQVQPLLDQVALALVQARLFADINKSNEHLRQEMARRQRVEEELRDSEDKWRLLSSNIPDFVAVIDADGRVLSANRPLRPAGGEGEVCEVVCECDGLGNGPLLKGWIDLVFWTGEQAHFEIAAADNANGVSREFSISPIGAGDNISRAIFIARDISERKQREEQLKRLERLRVQGELAAGVSHNLNNMLTGVLLPAQMLRRVLSAGRERREVDDIIKSAQRARDLVQRLHRSVGPPQPVRLDPVHIRNAVEEAMMITRPRWQDEAQGRGIDIVVELNLPDELPPICGEASGLCDMMVNLLLNACEAMPEGGRIAIDGSATSSAVCIRVSDSGIGMDAETRAYIFDPFFTTKDAVGTGLGLSTLRSMVEQWDGRVEVESASGEGASFALYLPIWRAAETNASDGKTTAIKERAARVLAVDDEVLVREVLGRLLGDAERLSVVASSAEALEIFAPGRFEVALIDLAMPGMPGDHLAHELRRLDPYIALVLLSGLDVPEGDPRRAPFDLVLQKPCTAELIFDGLDRAMEIYRGRE